MKHALVPAILCLFASVLFGGEALRDYLQAQAIYWGISISESDLTQLAALKQTADQPGLSMDDRTKAYKELFEFTQKLRGFPQGNTPAAKAATLWTEGRPIVPAAQPTAKSKQLGNWIKRGNGPISMILIPDLGADWTVFESFMKRNQSKFTFYAITLPGFGGTNPPARPKVLNFGGMQWWDNAADALLDLISKFKLVRPLVLGHQAGSYLAMKLALQHPDLFRGVIVLNGLLYAPMPGISQSATPAERARIVNTLTPAELFPNVSPAHYKEVMMAGAPWFCKEKICQEHLTELTTQSGGTVWWNYFAELATTDLSSDIKSLKVPMLVLPSIHDAASPGTGPSTMALDQWKPLDQSSSSLPITVIPIQDCRIYATEDQPAKLDELVVGWTAQITKQ